MILLLTICISPNDECISGLLWFNIRIILIQQNSKFVFIIVVLLYGITVLRLICMKICINNIHSVL